MALKKEDSQLADKDQNPLIGMAQPFMADVEDDNTVSSEFDDAEVKAIVDGNATAINTLKAVLVAHGLMKSS